MHEVRWKITRICDLHISALLFEFNKNVFLFAENLYGYRVHVRDLLVFRLQYHFQMKGYSPGYVSLGLSRNWLKL
jgi:hypothetical protein